MSQEEQTSKATDEGDSAHDSPMTNTARSSSTISHLKVLIERFLRFGKYEPSLNIILIFSGIISVTYFLYILLVSQVTESVLHRMEMSQEILNARIMNDNEDYDDALIVLAPFIERAKNDDIEEKLFLPLVDIALHSLAQSYDPLDRTPEYKDLLQIMDDIAPHPWRHQQIGLYLLRTGQVDEARKRFQFAIDDPRSSEDTEVLSNTYWFFCLSYLTQGDVARATEMARQAEGINPRFYDRGLVSRDIFSLRNDRVIAGLSKQYKSFSGSLGKFLETVAQPN